LPRDGQHLRKVETRLLGASARDACPDETTDMTMVAVCGDASSPVEGAAFSACASVAWTDSSNLSSGLFDGLTLDSACLIGAGVLMLWGFAYGIRRVIAGSSTV
jgi:hypothetical protein